jgi:hypothetical protein
MGAPQVFAKINDELIDEKPREKESGKIHPSVHTGERRPACGGHC